MYEIREAGNALQVGRMEEGKFRVRSSLAKACRQMAEKLKTRFNGEEPMAKPEPESTLRTEATTVTPYKIECGIPLPPAKPRRVRRGAPWDDMQAGDSVLLDGDGARAINSARRYCKHHRPDLRVEVRPEGQGVRLWLVAAWTDATE